MTRTPEEIATTATGPRPLPPLDRQRVARKPSLAEATLDSGLRVVAVRRAGVPMVELRLVVPLAGTHRTHAARAELLAATLTAGTATRSRWDVDTELAAVGGELAVAVDPERLSLGAAVLAEGLPRALEVLADVLTAATFPGRQVEGERDRLVERLDVARSRPGVAVREALLRRALGEHPSVHEMPASADVAAVSAAAVRTMHRRSVLPAGSLLVLVGDLRPARTLERVAQALAGWTATGTATTLPPWRTPPPGPLELLDRPGAVQSQVRLVADGVSRHDPTYPAAQLANLVLGGYFSSRLVENVREDKGLTYGAHSGFDATTAGTLLTVELDTARETTAAALWETRYELGRMLTAPPTDDEVDAARRYAVGSLTMGLATQAGMASNLSRLVPLGLDVDWVRTHPARLAATTADDVRAAAARLFAPSRFVTVVQGDAAELAGPLAALGPVAQTDPTTEQTTEQETTA
ncbi:pitrilysin family protein [Rhodococcus aerolatus]